MHLFSIDQTRLVFSSSLRCSCSRTDHPPSRCTCRYTWHPPCARCTYDLQLLGALTGFPPGMLSAPSPGVLVVACLGIQISSTNLQLRFSAGKCAPRCFLPALPMQWLLEVRVDFDSGTVIPLLYVVALQTTNPLRLLQVPYRLIRLGSEVDFQ